MLRTRAEADKLARPPEQEFVDQLQRVAFLVPPRDVQPGSVVAHGGGVGQVVDPAASLRCGQARSLAQRRVELLYGAKAHCGRAGALVCSGPEAAVCACCGLELGCEEREAERRGGCEGVVPDIGV